MGFRDPEDDNSGPKTELSTNSLTGKRLSAPQAPRGGPARKRRSGASRTSVGHADRVYAEGQIPLRRTRPKSPPPPSRSAWEANQLPGLSRGGVGHPGSTGARLVNGEALPQLPGLVRTPGEANNWGQVDNASSLVAGDGDDEESCSGEAPKLSMAARLLEEDRRKVQSIRSFLLNFMEDRDGSIKRRIDLGVHQTETGRPVTDAIVQEVCKMRPSMAGLDLRGCLEVTDVGLWCIARHTVALKELCLAGCHGVTNVGLRSLALRSPGLEVMDFTGCTKLDDAGLRIVGAGCWKLRSLSLDGCGGVTDAGVADLAAACTSLTSLNVSRCHRVGERSDRALVQLGRSCPLLRRLDAYGCRHTRDAGLTSVARGCLKLEKLMLTGCSELTGQSVRALAKGCTDLSELSLSGCCRLANRDLVALARGCVRLKRLDIAECGQVNAQGLAALASGLKSLTELNLSACKKVDDDGLRALKRMNAHHLNLSRCPSVTEDGISHIALNCTALQSLDVTGCEAISRGFMMHLCFRMRFSEPASSYFGFQVLIYVFDIESQDWEKDLNHYGGVVEAIEQNSPDARIFVLIHKMDLVAEDHRDHVFLQRQELVIAHSRELSLTFFKTSIWDETLYKAWSSIVCALIPNISVLESHLENFCKICDADEVVLFERATFLVISHATQAMYYDIHRFEKISNIIKQFKLSVSKTQAQFQGMEVRNSRFVAFISAFTANTYIMVIQSDPTIQPATTQLNINAARRHFERFVLQTSQGGG